ncbi:2'-5' RNA ligase family protein [Streptacidiphilus jiangxiensis]|uniref:2'-5' RNA ligase n=1 Tax=Streptacidiphilus jiangxiensis TaxID=235985 RepID=A0A1H8B340_STRJI|nr:2'-5' RNA ligase family protein [Streptacidiphilus jiangxiensis]SEM76709.1 2'-5' RNA ligase [Streptacidiphilus jiangxiensis]
MGEHALSLLATDSRSFPVDPPGDLDAAAAIVRTDQQAFDAVGRMKDHWARPGWSDRTRRLYWMATFDRDRALVDRATQCQRALTDLGLDPVPADGLHLTLLRIGDASAVAPATVDTLAEKVAAIALPRLPLLAHPLAGSRGAVRFSVTPWTGLVALHAQLAQAGRELGVPGGSGTAGFRPHLGIAYNPVDRDARPVVAAVGALRHLAPVAVTVEAVDLVELRRERSAYRWTVRHRVPLV